MKYSCPKCKARLEIQKTFNKKFHISCSCGIEDLLEFKKNIDEVYLDFLDRFDNGLIHEEGVSNELKNEGIIRDEDEIKTMLKKENADSITKTVLFSKKDYISQYKVLTSPEPEMGCAVEDSGLDDSITDYLRKSQIKQFYKFQETAIEDILFGDNVVIEAPTASGKTEAFVIPIVQKIKKMGGIPRIFAVFVYPTKALARDQAPKI
ncbi:MAG: DEAD/DEAH box helicase, partial [Nitrosarchaeum sp.]|nr:DEAD/DEAH box helicase [Nitrosarchaeum sp.]